MKDFKITQPTSADSFAAVVLSSLKETRRLDIGQWYLVDFTRKLSVSGNLGLDLKRHGQGLQRFSKTFVVSNLI